MRRANRLGGGYQPIVEEEELEEIREEGELEQEVPESGSLSQLVDTNRVYNHQHTKEQINWDICQRDNNVN